MSAQHGGRESSGLSPGVIGGRTGSDRVAQHGGRESSGLSPGAILGRWTSFPADADPSGHLPTGQGEQRRFRYRSQSSCGCNEDAQYSDQLRPRLSTPGADGRRPVSDDSRVRRSIAPRLGVVRRHREVCLIRDPGARRAPGVGVGRRRCGRRVPAVVAVEAWRRIGVAAERWRVGAGASAVRVRTDGQNGAAPCWRPWESIPAPRPLLRLGSWNTGPMSRSRRSQGGRPRSGPELVQPRGHAEETRIRAERPR